MNQQQIPPPQNILEQLIHITHALSAELSLSSLYNQIIATAQEFTNADGGTLYILEGEGQQQHLRFAVVRNSKLQINNNQQKLDIEPINLWHTDGSANQKNVCAYVWHTHQIKNISDVYNIDNFDFSGAQKFDAQMNYHTKSLLTIPLQNYLGDIIGVLQLINARTDTGEISSFNPESQPVIMALASIAAVTLEKQQFIESHKNLLDAFIKTIAKAIDAKSKHTSAHCQRIPVLMEMFAQAACDDQSLYHDFALDEEQWYELKVAAWLHDCGKLSTPDFLLDKATKLHTLNDSIEAIKARFAALIAQYNWFDYQGQAQPLLTKSEVEMLCIERGTLSTSERQQINNHIDVTIEMLESLPFPKSLAKVPEYAGGHHEKIDGSGFPKGLTGDQMSIPARMMAIVDIFEALTARERPYKDPMPLSQALSILQNMRDQRKIDPDLYKLFLTAKVWEKYSTQYLLPEQLDISDIANYL